MPAPQELPSLLDGSDGGWECLRRHNQRLQAQVRRLDALLGARTDRLQKLENTLLDAIAALETDALPEPPPALPLARPSLSVPGTAAAGPRATGSSRRARPEDKGAAAAADANPHGRGAGARQRPATAAVLAKLQQCHALCQGLFDDIALPRADALDEAAYPLLELLAGGRTAIQPGAVARALDDSAPQHWNLLDLCQGRVLERLLSTACDGLLQRLGRLAHALVRMQFSDTAPLLGKACLCAAKDVAQLLVLLPGRWQGEGRHSEQRAAVIDTTFDPIFQYAQGGRGWGCCSAEHVVRVVLSPHGVVLPQGPQPGGVCCFAQGAQRQGASTGSGQLSRSDSGAGSVADDGAVAEHCVRCFSWPLACPMPLLRFGDRRRPPARPQTGFTPIASDWCAAQGRIPCTRRDVILRCRPARWRLK